MTKEEKQLLKNLQINNFKRLNPEVPERYSGCRKYDDKTANQLTTSIIWYCRYNGVFATRLNSTGIYNKQLKQFIPSRQMKGLGDVMILYKGVYVSVEVKIKDKQSQYQIRAEKEINQSGGYYFVCHNFAEFLAKYKDTIKQIDNKFTH